jgi:hypothetical protein
MAQPYPGTTSQQDPLRESAASAEPDGVQISTVKVPADTSMPKESKR